MLLCPAQIQTSPTRTSRSLSVSFPAPQVGQRAVSSRGVAEADRPRVAGAVDAVLALAPFRTTLRKFSGKCVFELRPSAAWNKGEAALYLLDMVRKAEGGAHDWFDGVQPIYVGDDVTDEDAFKALAPFGAVATEGRRQWRPRALAKRDAAKEVEERVDGCSLNQVHETALPQSLGIKEEDCWRSAVSAVYRRCRW